MIILIPQVFSAALKLTIEANQTEIWILLRAEMAKNGAKAIFVDLGEKNYFESVTDVLFCPKTKQYSYVQGYITKIAQNFRYIWPKLNKKGSGSYKKFLNKP